ncbi:tetratricopeptide repeat protein [candidate division CSSED10-310 bacterium]|uniref:Tetratricopeptide repeat protein n=1 Tax=candidate division CSSED10-310 bacterium TaxID=2855610 RepID=A0ABV6Z6M6_UNCC1
MLNQDEIKKIARFDVDTERSLMTSDDSFETIMLEKLALPLLTNLGYERHSDITIVFPEQPATPVNVHVSLGDDQLFYLACRDSQCSWSEKESHKAFQYAIAKGFYYFMHTNGRELQIYQAFKSYSALRDRLIFSSPVTSLPDTFPLIQEILSHKVMKSYFLPLIRGLRKLFEEIPDGMPIPYIDGLCDNLASGKEKRELLIRAAQYSSNYQYLESIKLLRHSLVLADLSQGEEIALNTLLGTHFLAQGKLNQAADYFGVALASARTLAKSSQRKEGLSAALANMGIVYHNQGYFDDALTIHHEALDNDNILGYQPGTAHQLTNIGNIYRSKGDLDEAMKHLSQALTIYREIGHKISEAHALGDIGLIYSDKGYLDGAIGYFQDAIKVHKEVRDTRGQAHQLANIGIIYRIKGNLYYALEYLNDSLVLHQQTAYKHGEAIVLSDLGLVFSGKGDYQTAINCQEQALAIYKQIGYSVGEALQLGNIGHIYKEKGAFDDALNYYQKSLAITRETGHRQREAHLVSNIGLIYKHKREFDDALRSYQQALDIDCEIGYKQGEVIDMANMGLIYYFKSDYEQAQQKLHQALIDHEYVPKHALIKPYYYLSLIYFKKNDYLKGFEYITRALSSAVNQAQYNSILFHMLRAIKEMLVKNEWENLEKIEAAYTSNIILDESWITFFTALHYYARSHLTTDATAQEMYQQTRAKMDIGLKDMLDKLLDPAENDILGQDSETP